MIVEETMLDNEGSIVVDSVDSNVSVKSGVGEKKLDNETVLVNECKIVAEAHNDIDDVDNGLAVSKPVGDSKGDDVMDCVAKFVTEIIALVVIDEEALLRIDGVTDDEVDMVAASVNDGAIVAEALKDIDNVDNGLAVAIGIFETENKFV